MSITLTFDYKAIFNKANQSLTRLKLVTNNRYHMSHMGTTQLTPSLLTGVSTPLDLT